MDKKPDAAAKRKVTRKSGEIELSDAERSLLRKLSAKPSSRSTIGVVLSDDEMDFLRKLSSIQPPAESAAGPPHPGAGKRTPKRTSDLAISEEEMALLKSLALGEAVDAAGGGERGPQRKTPKRTTEIVLSPGEIEFLRRISGTETGRSQARTAVRQKLRGGELAAGPGREIVLELTRTEAQWLNQLTTEGESFITEEERSARLQLREKLNRATAERRSRS